MNADYSYLTMALIILVPVAVLFVLLCKLLVSLIRYFNRK